MRVADFALLLLVFSGSCNFGVASTQCLRNSVRYLELCCSPDRVITACSSIAISLYGTPRRVYVRACRLGSLSVIRLCVKILTLVVDRYGSVQIILAIIQVDSRFVIPRSRSPDLALLVKVVAEGPRRIRVFVYP